MERDLHTYPSKEEAGSDFIVSESATALADEKLYVLPDDIDYADVVEGILQVTPDIEEEIAAAYRGETIQMDEFKTMFAKWLD